MTFPLLVFAQVNDPYNKIPEFKRPQSLSSRQLPGIFKWEFWFERWKLELDSSGNYTQIVTDCTERDSSGGRWKFNGHQLILENTSGTTVYDILQFRKFYLLVPVQYQKEFIKDIKGFLNEVKKSKDLNSDPAPYLLELTLTREIYPSS